MDEIQISRYMDRAKGLVEEGRLLHAAQLYQRIIEAEPDFEDAYSELSYIYFEFGKYEAAEKILLQALDHCKDISEILFMLGNLHLRLENYDRALEYYKMLEHRKMPQVHFNMGAAYFYKENLPQAEKHFRLTLKYDPNFPKINESLGELLIKRKAYTEAIKHLRRGIELDRYSWISHYLLGIAYSKIYDWKKSYREFVTALDIDPKEASTWQMCGEMLINLRRFDEAEQYLKKAFDLDPHFADTLVNFGYLYLQKGQVENASDYFNKALKLQPDNARAIEGRMQVKVLKRKTS